MSGRSVKPRMLKGRPAVRSIASLYGFKRAYAGRNINLITVNIIKR